ncbi:MAG TPA: UvrD-helicase domain-containing protein [Eoetvoesiella sp.]
MSIKQPSDSAVRLEAIDPAQSFLIRAPAGSGKTELLTDRVLALLATVNRPEEIVAITFTRKAASEMHARVLAKLQAGLGEPPLEEYKRRSWELAQKAMQRNDAMGWNLLQYPARLSVRTIDSFCSYIVRAMPWLSALGGLPAITENAREHYEAAAQATLAMADDVDAVATLIDHLDVDMRAAENLLADMLASRDHWLPLLASGGDAEQLIATLEHEIEKELDQLAAKLPVGWATSLAPSVARAAAALADSGEAFDLSALRDWQGEAFDTACADLDKWHALANVLLTGTDTLRRTVNKRQGFEAKSDYKDEFLTWLKSADESAPWVTALAEIRNAPLNGYQPDQLQTLQALIQVLWLASAQLNVRFAETGEVDFVEIAQRAIQALGQADDPTDLLLMLDTAIKHILVDEFQDTSQSQIELLKRLTAGWMPGDGRTLFLVGDPMQSIYRFRKAEVGWFLKVQEQGLGEIKLKPLHLTNNFRSQANVVQWVNRVFGPLFPAHNNPALGAISYTGSEAFNGAVEGLGVEFHPVWVTAAEDQAGQAGETAQRVAIQLAREALLRHADSDHPVAILVRARSHLDDIVHRLTQENIPCRAVELVSLKERQVVIDLVQLARALSHPADRLAWLSVLRSPLCGLTLNSLHSLFGSDHQIAAPLVLSKWLEQDCDGKSCLDAEDSQRLRRVARILLDRQNISGAIPFAAWLEYVWERLGGLAVYSTDSDRADAERLFRLIEKLAPYGGLNPVELNAKLVQLYAAPNSTGRAVEVMTIHKSKGLEFDTVILTGLHRRPRSETQPMLRFEHNDGELLLGPVRHRAFDEPDPVSEYLAQREKKRASYETDRLLYVGVTRAREQLHLIGLINLDDAGQAKAPAGSSLLGRLWDHMATPAVPALSELDDAAAPRQAPQQRPLVRIRDTGLLPQEAASKQALGGTPWQWRLESGDEATIGTVAHAWLERMGKDGIENWPVERLDSSVPVLRTQLSRAGLSASALEPAAEAVRQTLVATLTSEKGRWLLDAARAHREWSLLDISGRVSVIDLAIAHEGGWLVVDYKTGVPAAGEPVDAFSQRMRVRYAEQIQRYCSHVTALDGRPARGALYFPRADVWVDC